MTNAVKTEDVKTEGAPKRGRSLRRQLFFTLIAFAVVLASVITWGSVSAVRAHDRFNEQIERYDPAAINVRALMVYALDQETAVRGYAITREERYLDFYKTGGDQTVTVINRLHELLDGQPDFKAKVDETVTRLEAWRKDVADPHIAAIKAGGQASDLEISGLGKERFDSFRSAQLNLRDAIASQRQFYLEAISDAERQFVIALIGAVVIVVLMGMLFWFALRRWVTAPLEKLAADVKMIAQGNLNHEVIGSGPAEILRLGQDVEAMRHRITADLSEVRAARAELDILNTELTRSNGDLEQFAYVASHDLQEPLRKVSSFCQLLEQRYANELDDKAKQYIGFAVDGAKRMQQLINDLLAFSRVGRNVVDEEVSMDIATNQAVITLERSIDDADARVSIDELPTVNGDPTLLSALMQNLIGNAIKFHSPDRVPEIRITADRQDRMWKFAVTDNGIGIEPQYAEKVFVLFQRLHGRDQFDGTGIGLSLCKKIVEFHGGEIWIDLDADQGTTVRFTLPVNEKV